MAVMGTSTACKGFSAGAAAPWFTSSEPKYPVRSMIATIPSSHKTFLRSLYLGTTCGRGSGQLASTKSIEFAGQLSVQFTSSTSAVRSFTAASGKDVIVTFNGARAVTDEQKRLVKESWSKLKVNAAEHGHKMFLKVFEIAPSAKRLFSFLKDSTVPIGKEPHLKAHALNVFRMTGDAAVELGEKGNLDKMRPQLLDLGHTHVVYGVVDEHFDVVRFSLLKTIEEGLPESWSEELKQAWSDSYDAVADVIKNEMHARVSNPNK